MRLFKKSFPFINQLDSQDCGFACLKMIGKYYNNNFSIDNNFIINSNLEKQGVSISSLEMSAKELGFINLVIKLDFEKIFKNVPLPSIFIWNQNHFVVVYKVTNNLIYVADPAFGKIIYTKDEFIQGWAQNEKEGIILVLEPTEKIFDQSEEQNKAKVSLGYVTRYMIKHKTQLYFIILTLIFSSCVELIFPFFTQKIIDKGVALKDIPFIYLVLIAQIMLFLSKIGLEFYRSWLFIHISSRISLSIISDFLIKLMKLPLRFFNTKNIGDLSQRIEDHKRIEDFLSKDLIQTLFSFFSILIYSSILLYFNFTIFLVVLVAAIIRVLWIFNFIEKITQLDRKNFSLQSTDKSKIYELINTIQEIKLNNLEEIKTNQWQTIQKNIYLNNIDKLKVEQKFDSYIFISFLQTIIVVFVASLSVIHHQLTIGSMLSIMFILGGLNSTINQFINFIQQYELAKVSFERLNEIHNKKNEENLSKVQVLDGNFDIDLINIDFSYNTDNKILEDINLCIPSGKTTAIVGVSGSGKTTLIKLLLKFYEPKTGQIFVGNNKIEEIDNALWRNKCGVILQDSAIFSDTIRYNVTLEENPDLDNFKYALELANISEFIETLLLKENTIIGTEGIDISHGQRQRILIARAIYKNPDYLFFDEATNSLDTENEKIIVDNLNAHFSNKTMVIVAHRLSTVKNANQIIVLDKGKIIEKGNHDELIILKGKYFSLIKNQLELGQ
ncbi:peptidase domain-containing ABC transporter [Flavobacterium sp. ov086]|uniref:peptidase domain-containing ABC transporter n=1 Tax=Flavobacterium sp. ov086 TaxID=1761785 RepID=UPI000B6E6484|nr:peptidase domain-containing ABC transporter [Flavobacterium sp. ov086]SNR95142.1 ATP-binding cassette, subfamily B [Flavobacterium sp. ov086]